MRLLALLLLYPFLAFSQKEYWPHRQPLSPVAADLRSDSFDILKTTVEINLAAPPQLSATASLEFTTLISGTTTLKLDLQNLAVQSVELNGQPVNYSYQSPALNILFASPLPQGFSGTLRITYGGQPAIDPTGWGGFYFQNGYAFNLGVGFQVDPHSFGRAWFPCFDNFVERCAFEVAAVTAPNRPAYANGLLLQDTLLAADRRLRRWRLDEPIPSYLASVASGPYVSWKRTGPNNLPIEIAAPAQDTAKVSGTFKHLPDALECYTHWFGPYLWPRAGYSLVPFNSGAMEHATNVALMAAAVNGTTTQETLWAHELSHHWWGDLATCSDAGDMWLNEGWARYSEHLFTEWVYGEQAFREAVAENFLNVLETAHVDENGYRPVTGLPHNLTYGAHTYDKGAVVAHNLRGYLGDGLFRYAATTALAKAKFSDWSSAEFRDLMADASGMDLTAFFDNWVFQPGFIDITIDSTRMQGDSLAVFVKQKRRGAPEFYRQVPLEFTFYDTELVPHYRTAIISGKTDTVYFQLPFLPILNWVNTRLRLTLARADADKWFTQTGSYAFGDAKMTLVLSQAQDSALVRVEHHYAMPDTAEVLPPGFRTTNRYWTIFGTFPDNTPGNGTIYYDGRGQLDQLDTELFDQTSSSEDSVVLLYRSGPGQAWNIHPNYVQNFVGNANNRFGFMRFQGLSKGEYTFAKGAKTVGTVPPPADHDHRVTLAPNPAAGQIKILAEMPLYQAILVNSQGKKLGIWNLNGQTDSLIRIGNFPTGQYRLIFYDKKDRMIITKTLIIAR